MTTISETQPPSGSLLPEERWPTIQTYLTYAFAQWRAWDKNRDRNLTFVEMVHLLDHPQTLACLAGKLNQQVENGGLGQWVDNRYVDEATLWELINYTVLIQRHEIGRSGPGVHPTNQVEVLLRVVQTEAFGSKVWDTRLQDEPQLEQFAETLRGLTPIYLAHGGRFMDAVERYLVATYPLTTTAASAPVDTLSHRAALREVLDALGALSNPSELHSWIGDEDLQRRILEAAERPE